MFDHSMTAIAMALEMVALWGRSDRRIRRWRDTQAMKKVFSPLFSPPCPFLASLIPSLLFITFLKTAFLSIHSTQPAMNFSQEPLHSAA